MWDCLKRFIKSAFEDFRLFMLSITVIFLLVFFGWMILYPEQFTGEIPFRLSIVLNSFLILFFTWLLAGLSLEKAYQEKHRIPAIRSYRQAKTIGDNAKYLLNIVDQLLGSEVPPVSEIKRVRDGLHFIIAHVNNIKEDWGDVVKDISTLNKLEKVDEQIQDLSSSLAISHTGSNDFFHIKMKDLLLQKIALESQLGTMKAPFGDGIPSKNSSFSKDRKTFLSQPSRPYSIMETHAGFVSYRLKIFTDSGFDPYYFEANLGRSVVGSLIGFTNVKIEADSAEPNVYNVELDARGDLMENEEYIVDSLLRSDGLINRVNITEIKFFDLRKVNRPSGPTRVICRGGKTYAISGPLSGYVHYKLLISTSYGFIPSEFQSKLISYTSPLPISFFDIVLTPGQQADEYFVEINASGDLSENKEYIFDMIRESNILVKSIDIVESSHRLGG